jgi:hypothetical protein
MREESGWHEDAPWQSSRFPDQAALSVPFFEGLIVFEISGLPKMKQPVLFVQ